MNDGQVSRMTLHALEGNPLAHQPLREMVVATARAIAERNGLELIDVTTTPSSLTIALRASRIEAIGLLSELRRLTTKWYTSKFGVETLWGHAPDGHDDFGETWKQA